MARGSKTPLVVLAVAAALVLVASSTAAVARTLVDRRPSSETLLRRAERYTSDRSSVRFSGQTEVESRFSEERRSRVPEEQASSFTSRSSLEGVVAFPDRARVTVRTDGLSTEFLTAGDRSFARFAEEDEDIAGQQWVVLDPDEDVIGPAGGDVSGLNDPSSLPDLIGDASAPEIVRRDGRVHVVRARVEVDSGEDQGSIPLSGTLELTARDDGRVDRMVLDVTGGSDGSSVDAHVDFRFSGWGDAVDVTAPGGSEIDTTPSVDEERVAAYRDAPLLQPAGIPERWVLDLADVVPAEDTPEECDQVELDYVDPDDDEAGYLYLYELPVTCADLAVPPGASAFRAGPNRGWVGVDPEEGVLAQLTVGRTVVQAETDLPPAELARVLAELRPLDFAVTPAPIAGIGRTRA